MIYSYRGLTVPPGLLTRIRAGEAAGVIFFSENIASRAQIMSVIRELQQASARSPVKVPLLMMTDQEGGLIRRLPGAPLRSEKEIGASSDPVAAARRAGRTAGLNLKGVGMNVNLAPVLDVYRRAGDLIDEFDRSYGTDPQKVAQAGDAFIAAQQQAGVAATAKHFPGLGAATRAQDTDRRPVTLRVPLTIIRAIDEAPYPAAIAAGVRLVMVSWATYPALDENLPAGLSPTVVQGELRQRLAFTGVTISDALGAGALRPFGATAARAVLAARAGMDLLLCGSKRVSEGTAARSALASALRRGQLDRRAFMTSVERVMTLRSSMGG